MQKVISGFFIIVCFVALSTLGLATQARADFNQGSGYSFLGNQAWGWATADDAVVTSVSSSTSYEVNQENGEVTLHTNTFFSGVFVDPILVNPTNDIWCQYLAEEGLRNNSYLQLGMIVVNGINYVPETLVSLQSVSLAGLYYHNEIDWLNGWFSADVFAVGAIPISSSVIVNITNNVWSVNTSSGWLVTTPFHLVPAPGAFALLCVGGLVGTPRRRRS
ncbi:hypothetical protein EXS61_01830 [Candidatus Parcubacteria bacterium]|nr:hypothetical protein [Candidatus Parcubacteria bacterium]